VTVTDILGSVSLRNGVPRYAMCLPVALKLLIRDAVDVVTDARQQKVLEHVEDMSIREEIVAVHIEFDRRQ
jgi:hypothetical protein